MLSVTQFSGFCRAKFACIPLLKSVNNVSVNAYFIVRIKGEKLKWLQLKQRQRYTCNDGKNVYSEGYIQIWYSTFLISERSITAWQWTHL